MSKKYYWILDGKYYEVSKETYQKYKKEHDHSKMLQEYENEVHIFSLDAMAAADITGYGVIADTNVNVEDGAIHNIMLSNLKQMFIVSAVMSLYVLRNVTYQGIFRSSGIVLGLKTEPEQFLFQYLLDI